MFVGDPHDEAPVAGVVAHFEKNGSCAGGKKDWHGLAVEVDASGVGPFADEFIADPELPVVVTTNEHLYFERPIGGGIA